MERVAGDGVERLAVVASTGWQVEVREVAAHERCRRPAGARLDQIGQRVAAQLKEDHGQEHERRAGGDADHALMSAQFVSIGAQWSSSWDGGADMLAAAAVLIGTPLHWVRVRRGETRRAA